MIAMRFEGGPLDGKVRVGEAAGSRFEVLIRNTDGSVDRAEYEWVEHDAETDTLVGRHSRTVAHAAAGYRERSLWSLIWWALNLPDSTSPGTE